jgi:hypothetical protein
MHARFKSDESISRGAEGRIDGSCLGKKLMKTERQDGIALAGFDEAQVDFTDPQEQGRQVSGACFLAFTAVSDEHPCDFRQLPRSATFQSATRFSIHA